MVMSGGVLDFEQRSKHSSTAWLIRETRSPDICFPTTEREYAGPAVASSMGQILGHPTRNQVWFALTSAASGTVALYARARVANLAKLLVFRPTETARDRIAYGGS